MTTIELASCVVFQFIDLTGEAILDPKNVLVFDKVGEDIPGFGFIEGQQVYCFLLGIIEILIYTLTIFIHCSNVLDVLVWRGH